MAEPWAECIIDDANRGVFRVRRTAFTSDEVFERERTHVFDRSWVYVGHESEVPNSGDFVSRDVAGRPMILIRGHDDVVRVLLNTCSHRGAQVCRERKGNTKNFLCPYHAWNYANDGRLIAVQDPDGYADGFDKSELGLRSPARTTSYRGFVWMSFNADIVDIETYLADAKEQLDLICDQSEEGLEVVRGTQEYCMYGNWKLLVENSIDGYHGNPTHMRYMDWLQKSDAVTTPLEGVQNRGRDLGNGHALMEYASAWGRPVARWVPAFGEAAKARIENTKRALDQRFGEARADRIAQMSRNLLIFPNLIVNDIMAVTVRTFFPIAPDHMNITAWCIAPKGEHADDRHNRLDNFLTFLGPGGYATPDDVEMLESCQKGFRNTEVEYSDISRGMNEKEPLPAHELQMRAFWRRWNAMITDEPAAAKIRAV